MDIRKNRPVRLQGARVWRTYLGGKMLDHFYGAENGEDGHFPEMWIASLVEARNTGREDIVEGLSLTASADALSLKELIQSDPDSYLGKEHTERWGESMGVLVKLIDSSERLTVQVHPDKEAARRLFQSKFGKTECWHILGGRTIEGQPPCVYLGFRPGVTEETWKQYFKEQDIEGMLSCLHKVEVHPGDTILIQGGVPHAIGAGCFLIEIQEPTDYTVRVERTTPSGERVSDFMCHQGLGFERMFECFHYDSSSEEDVIRKYFIPKEVIEEKNGNQITCLAGKKQTPCFSMNLLEVRTELAVQQKEFCAVLILEGEGILEFDGAEEKLTSGDQFFFPANMGKTIWKSKNGTVLKAVLCMGPE